VKKTKKNERRERLLAVGVIILLLGGIAIYNGLDAAFTWDTFATRILKIIGGSFLMVIGAWCSAWGVSDEAGKNASRFLQSVWGRLLEALRS
jgi:hypothetical protein